MKNGAGDAIVDRIFRQNTSSPNFITALLGRSDDPDHPFPGSFSIGEIVAGYENVTTQPKLNVTSVTKGNSGSQHWQVLVDPDGILGPDGKPINSYNSKVSSTADKTQLTAIFDTGFSLPQVPKYVRRFSASCADAEYVQVNCRQHLWPVREGPIQKCVDYRPSVDVAVRYGSQHHHSLGRSELPYASPRY